MASPGQKKGACGHIMASFDKHSRCARCREKGHGDDPCVQNLQCDFCSVLTPEQVLKLSTPTYKLRKEKAKAKEVLVDPSSVVVLDTQPEQEPDVSVSSAPDLSLPVPQFKKDLQELDEKWSTRMARLEALITLGHRPSPSVQQNPSFSPVKVPVSHAAPAGALSQTPFFVTTSASSGPAGPAVGPDEARDQDVSFADRQSTLQNLYPEAEPMFKTLLRWLLFRQLLCLLPLNLHFNNLLPAPGRSPSAMSILRKHLKRVSYLTQRNPQTWKPQTWTGSSVKIKITARL